jgi:hypothetical protein
MRRVRVVQQVNIYKALLLFIGLQQALELAHQRNL